MGILPISSDKIRSNWPVWQVRASANPWSGFRKTNAGYSPQPAFEERWGDKANASVERGKASDVRVNTFRLSRLAALGAKGLMTNP
jgi:hypothetical protein